MISLKFNAGTRAVKKTGWVGRKKHTHAHTHTPPEYPAATAISAPSLEKVTS